MIIFLKLLFAHFVGDFLIQPKSWVDDKEARGIRSAKLYWHVLVHGGITFIVLWDIRYITLVLTLMIVHWGIDALKLSFQNESSQTQWFLFDQVLHLISLLVLWWIWDQPAVSLVAIFNGDEIWIYLTALLFLTAVSNIVMQVLMHQWSKALDENNEESLRQAGKYIGILERLFVFTFVITSNWEAIGFLLAAKSVFRFGDLKESKDRKLTEYILIGTLLSFGMAIAAGLAVVSLIK